MSNPSTNNPILDVVKSSVVAIKPDALIVKAAEHLGLRPEEIQPELIPGTKAGFLAVRETEHAVERIVYSVTKKKQPRKPSKRNKTETPAKA